VQEACYPCLARVSWRRGAMIPCAVRKRQPRLKEMADRRALRLD
jgi:hypothetical protein